jgi:hypothetical protein
MPDKGWSRAFDDPVPSPRRRRAAHPPRRGQLYLQAPEARARCAAMARGDPGAHAGRRARRRHHAAQDRDHAGDVSWRGGADAA